MEAILQTRRGCWLTVMHALPQNKGNAIIMILIMLLVEYNYSEQGELKSNATKAQFPEKTTLFSLNFASTKFREFREIQYSRNIGRAKIKIAKFNTV